MGARAIEVDNLSKRYRDVWALDKMSLMVDPGQIMALVGTNGSGKTTTLRLLSGLIRPTTGQIKLLGRPVHAALPRVGIVMEDPAFYPHLGPLEHIEYALSYSRNRMSKAQKTDALDSVGLSVLNRPVRSFSLGMRRRLALAVALVKKPDLLLLDEPSNGLDLDGMELLGRIIREKANEGVACLLSSHNWDEVERLVDMVVVLHKGKVLHNGRRAELQAPRPRWVIKCLRDEAGVVLQGISGLTIVESTPDEYLVELHSIAITDVTTYLVKAGCPPERVHPHHHSLSEAYRALVEGE